jgi:SNF2 family DNA or RNA helicase
MADELNQEQKEMAELLRITTEYAKAYQEVNSSIAEEQDAIKAYFEIGRDPYHIQEPDPEPEKPYEGPSPLFTAIGKLAQNSLEADEPDPFLIGMAALGERKWTEKQRMAMWLMCTTKYRNVLSAMGIDAVELPRPELEKIVHEAPKPIKEIWCDDRSMGFIVRFRYLLKDEFVQVRRGISNIVGRQYHDGSRVDSRLDEPHWIIPGDAPSIESLMKYLVDAINGKRFGYDPARWTFGEEEKTPWTIKDGVAERIQFIMTRSETMVRMSAAHSTEWKPAYEYGNGKQPFPFQIAGVEYILSVTEESRISAGRYGTGVMVSDPMGMGKTVEGLMAVNEAWEQEMIRNPKLKRGDLHCLIMCPAAVKINWAREINYWLDGLDYKVQILRGLSIQPIWGNFVICNPQLIRKEYNKETYEWEPAPLYIMLLAKKWFSVIADESHQYKNWKAQRTSAALELFSGRRYNVRKLAMEHWRFPVPMRIMMSGSPVLNRPEEFTAQLEALGVLDQFGGMARFENMYAGRSSQRLKELNLKLREKGYLRREKEDMVLTPGMRVVPLKNVSQDILNTTWVPREQWDRVLREKEYEFIPGVLGQLPPKIRTATFLDLSNRKEYNFATNNFLQWLRENVKDMDDPDGRVSRAARAEALVRINKLKWLCARGKLKECINWINRFMDETDDQKLVIYVDHRDVHADLCEAFPDSARIIGGQDEDKRQANVDLFQNNPQVRLMIAMLTAGGIGITLTAANHMAFLELGWTPAIHDQAEDRIWGRVNDLHGASIYYLIAERTIDTYISALIDSKRERVTAATQGADVDETALITELAAKMLRDAAIIEAQIKEKNEDENGDTEGE